MSAVVTSGRDAWPVDPAPAHRPDPHRPDWRETLRSATDLALLGIVTTIAALGVLTAGAALATASTAVHQWTVEGSWPSPGELIRRFGRALLPGLGASATAIGIALLLATNLSLISRGVVPGGTVLMVSTVTLLTAAAGLSGIVLVEIGRRDGQGWRQALRAALRTAEHRPLTVAAATGVIALAATLAVLVVPLLAPVLAGYTLFALHTILRPSGLSVGRERGRCPGRQRQPAPFRGESVKFRR